MTFKKTSMVSGGIFFVEFIGALIKAVIKRGGNEESIYHALKSNSTLIEKIAELIVGGKQWALKNLQFVETFPAKTEGFTKNSFFEEGTAKLYFQDDFKSWILPEFPETIPAFTGNISKFKLIKPMFDSEMKEELRNPTPFTVAEFAAVISSLISRQPKGEEGTLLNNGYANIFHVERANGTVVAVDVGWDSFDRVWRFSAFELECEGRWDNGFCLFFRS